jgi:tryptophanyl-tRNA synthetase
MGLDGQAKMSKSLGNTIGVLEPAASVWEKLRPAVTDPNRVRKSDPGTPEVCNLYHLHRAFNAPAIVEDVATRCRNAGWGCIDCKRVLFEGIESTLVPIRARAEEINARPTLIDDVLAEGAHKASAIARTTMAEVKSRMGLRVYGAD